VFARPTSFFLLHVERAGVRRSTSPLEIVPMCREIVTANAVGQAPDDPDKLRHVLRLP